MAIYGDADLVFTADVAYTRTLRYAINAVNISWLNYTWLSQVRTPDGVLMFDLTTFLVPAAADPTALVLTIAANLVFLMPKDARWDILATSIATPTTQFRTPQPSGRVLVLPGVSHRG